MLRRLLWLVLGILAGFFLARHRGRVETAEPAAGEVDPAQELRRKLDEVKEREAPTAPAAAADDVEARRGDVHERGRSALDEMRRSTPG